MTHQIDTWKGCYPSKWKGLIVPKAMTHPAKFSSRLIRRIYDHMIEEGWLRVGDTVVDPFGGVALGGLEAMRHGLRWLGIELEQKFVDLGGQNIDLWNQKFSRLPKWGSAQLLQGDSRVLLKLLSGEVSGTVSSPPYAEARVGQESGQEHCGHGDQYGSSQGQLGGMQEGDLRAAISSPPFRHSEGGTPEPKEGGVIDKVLQSRHAAGNSAAEGYGSTDGNLANMAEGSLDGLVSSPPFAGTQTGGGINVKGYHNEQKRKGVFDLVGKRSYTPENQGEADGQISNMPEGDFQATISSPPFVNGSEGVMRADKFKDPEAFAREQMKRGHGASFKAKMKAMQADNDRAEYGDSDGQISGLPEGDLTAAISSPPYEGSMHGSNVDPEEVARRKTNNSVYGSFMTEGRKQAYATMMAGYNPDNEENLGTSEGETFWSAAHTIVEQVYLALTPGGHAVWVVKDYIKSKEKVEFSNQWRLLCESVGFVTLHEHHAELVHAKQHHFDGGIQHRASKSFFRRLAEHKAATTNFFATLTRDAQSVYFRKAHRSLWEWYNSLTDEEKRETVDGENLKYTPPNRSKIRNAAHELAFEDSGEAEESWNSATRIDFEVVLCMVKE